MSGGGPIRISRRLAAAVIAIVQALLLAGCGGGGSTTTIRSVKVPNLVGLAPMTAIKVVCASGLQLGTIQEQHHSTVLRPGQTPRIRVISTQPVAAIPVRPGAAVNLVIWTPANLATAYQYRCTGSPTIG